MTDKLYWAIDESSYRIDKTTFPSPDEAVQKASECARILGRDIQVYEYRDGVQYEYGMVAPDGTLKPGVNPTKHPPAGGPGGSSTLDLGEQRHAAVLGALDEVAEALEARGSSELAEEVDAASVLLQRVTAADKYDELKAAIKGTKLIIDDYADDTIFIELKDGYDGLEDGVVSIQYDGANDEFSVYDQAEGGSHEGDPKVTKMKAQLEALVKKGITKANAKHVEEMLTEINDHLLDMMGIEASVTTN